MCRQGSRTLRHPPLEAGVAHVLRHSAAMELLQAGVDCSVIALWLGHEAMETTLTYLHARSRAEGIRTCQAEAIRTRKGRTISAKRPAS
ncbi:tyrosine-type recombinase/integrase [Mesorhizobium sp. M0276]|uniref:tyrosine-type recombinase/integrase n=1 Tax=Mesorhizobium sp. M0276 TaxID=2956928 RepID=UPI003338C2CF